MLIGRNWGFLEYKFRQPCQTLVCCPPFLMSDSKGDKFEREIVVVGRQLAVVNQKLQSQFKTMKELIHEYEASLVVEEMMDCLGQTRNWE